MRLWRWLLVLGIALCACAEPSWATHASSHHSSAGGVHVRGYFRKDGTYVAPHQRRAPAGAPAPGSESYRLPGGVTRSPSSGWKYGGGSSRTYSSPSPRTEFYGLRRDAHGQIERSETARRAFMRTHPCPSTGRMSGPCPGYVVDHVRALKHGGLDAPSNMQWQTVGAAKAKDKWE